MNILTHFLNLVKISSPSKEELGVSSYIKNIVSKYEEIEIYEDNTGEKINGTCGNLIVKINGQGEPIAFDAHMDTVEPCEKITPILKGSKVYSDGTSILGADDKAGIAVMISLIEEIIEKNIPHPPITFIFSVCEENSLQGAKNIEKNIIKDLKYIFVLDGEGEIGTAIVKTPYGCKGNIKIIGKEAHAGVSPEKGINALCVAAEAISYLKIGRVDKNTTSNIGVISGGKASNIVMGSVEMKFEARSYEKEELIKFIDNVKNVFLNVCKKNNATLEENLRYGTPGYYIKENDSIIKIIKLACEKIGVRFNGISCGGGSNANVYRKHGINAINLGLNMKDEHSKNEHIDIKDLETLKRLLLEIIGIMKV